MGRWEVEEEEEEKVINEDTFAEGASAVDRLSLDRSFLLFHPLAGNTSEGQPCNF